MNPEIRTHLELIVADLETVIPLTESAVVEAAQLRANGYAVTSEVMLRQVSSAMQMRKAELEGAIQSADPESIVRTLMLLNDDYRYISELDMSWSATLQRGLIFEPLENKTVSLLFAHGSTSVLEARILHAAQCSASATSPVKPLQKPS